MKISDSDLYFVEFQTMQIWDPYHTLSPCEGPVSVFNTFIRFLTAVLCLASSYKMKTILIFLKKVNLNEQK